MNPFVASGWKFSFTHLKQLELCIFIEYQQNSHPAKEISNNKITATTFFQPITANYGFLIYTHRKMCNLLKGLKEVSTFKHSKINAA